MKENAREDLLPVRVLKVLRSDTEGMGGSWLMYSFEAGSGSDG